MPDRPPTKMPAVFYRTVSGGEVVLDWLRDLDEADRHAIGLDFDACAVPLAGRNAIVQEPGRRLVGNPHLAVGRADCKDAILRTGFDDTGALRIHEKDAENTRRGTRACPEANE